MRNNCGSTASGRWLLIHTLTLMYNLSNLALYFESSNEFPEHMGWLDQRLSESSVGYQVGFFSIILICLSFLACSNQPAYFKTISDLRPSSRNKADESTLEKILKKRDLVVPGIGATFKGLVSSTSLLARLNSPFGWTIAAICLPGNVLAQFSVFAKPFVEKLNWHWPFWPRWIIANFLALSYNIPNVALYFNTGDEFLEHVGVIDHRLTEGDTAWEHSLVALLVFFSLVMLISQQPTFSGSIADLATNPNKTKEEKGCNMNFYNRYKHSYLGTYIAPGITAFYRTIITSLSLLADLYVPTGSWVVGTAVASICFPGNAIAQFSILKPSKQHKGYETIGGSEKERSRCFGLFGEKVSGDYININLPESGKDSDYSY